NDVLGSKLLEIIKSPFLGERLVYKHRNVVKNIITENINILISQEYFQQYIYEKKEIAHVLDIYRILLEEFNKDKELIKKVQSRYNQIVSQEDKIVSQHEDTFIDRYKRLEDFQNYEKYLKEIEKKRHFLNSLLGYYDTEFDKFYRYKNFFHHLDKTTKGIITWFINLDIDSEKWNDALLAVYFYSILKSQEKGSHSFHTDNHELGRLSEVYGELEKLQKNIIIDDWNKRLRDKAFPDFKILYNLNKNRRYHKSNSLRKIIDKDFNLFTSIFPVILTNPITADSILPLEVGIFDVVIFDEASQLKIEDTFTSFLRGKYKVIAGDKHQMPPSNYFQSSESSISQDEEIGEDLEKARELSLSESLLDYAEKIKHTQSYLDYHYRSHHPALIDFSNHAFYGGNLIPFPARIEYNPIGFYQVDGIYQDRKNDSEIEKVLDILKNDIHKNQDGEYPSVGVVTFNIEQRNAILDKLNEAKYSDGGFANKMEAISRKERFFVRNLENVQGDERDVIILSTVYGKDSDGKFLKRFGPLNQEKGYKLLNVAVTRARNKIYICTSIPRDQYLDYNSHLHEYKNNKRAILYSYLAYAYFIANRQTKNVDNLKSILKEYSHDQPRNNPRQGLTESPFEEEVLEYLEDLFGQENVILQQHIGGFRVDFLVKYKGNSVVIECDGKSYHASEEAYIHDMFRERQLKELGYEVYRIWSTNWWHNHKREIEKIERFFSDLAPKIDKNTDNDSNGMTEV
ncbi:MAG: DUF559 domain-containing protein, partial [Candidatus Spechtbacteria bacterium SB0662_bin_43]|nr:DUF559 domain-containing protein [Candidatus Spechtbacteria bacterium SB0662_bin_43]